MRNGANYIIGGGGHTRVNVFSEMFRQICRDYPSLPDARTLTEREILFFYEGIREELKRTTRPES